MATFSQGRWGALCALVLGIFCVGHAYAWNAPEDEYRKQIRVNEDIQPLGAHPFGEHINVYDGSLSFTQTDVSLPGNGPLLQIVRQFDAMGVSAKPVSHAEQVFGDWDLVLPHMETLTADSMHAYNSATDHYYGVNGWQTDPMFGADPSVDSHARCSNFTVPPMVRWMNVTGVEPWDPSEWWKGYHLVIPGQGSQDVLANLDTATKATYPAVTKEHWRFSCLASTANGEPGEGFMAQAPDGTKYWFNELVYRNAPSMSRALYDSGASLERGSREARMARVGRVIETLITVLSGSETAHAVPRTDNIFRRLGVLLVTRIEDRFGNSLTFSYDANGLLTAIHASDGRSVTLTYASGNVQAVTIHPASGSARTWQYAYAQTSTGYTTLRTVTQPDGSQWKYGLDDLTTASMRTSTIGQNCATVPVPIDLSVHTGTVTHPSGLTGSFTVKPIVHARSAVPMSCHHETAAYDPSSGDYVIIPYAWYSLTLTKETLSGAGTPVRTWSYAYSAAPTTWVNCAGGCTTTVHTDLTQPDGSAIRYTFSNKYDYTEGQLLRTDYYSGAVGSTRLRSEIDGYAPPTTSPLPAKAGGVLEDAVNYDQIGKYSPQQSHAIVQGGDTYTWQAEAFDSRARVTRARRFSSIAGQQSYEEQTDYLDDTTHWVLGLPTKVTNLNTGEVVDQNAYETTHDTLTGRWHFGQKLMSYAFNAQGQLASFTDGNGHTTTLGSYKRGIPQAIHYPDGRSQSLAVDDFGQITSITDQAGSTTGYSYDAAGRLTRITYPSGDEQPWYSKTFSYNFVTGSERGLAGNHWRRTVAKGNQRQVTYFNAELQPVLVDTYIYGDAGSHTNVRNDYDFRGQSVFASYPTAGTPNLSAITAGATTRYDALGRVTKSELTAQGGLLITTTNYLSGARTQVTDPKGNVTTTSYQVFDQPSDAAAIKVQAPTGLTQTITRDLYGNPLSITQGGSYNGSAVSVTKALTYDAYHRLCRTTEPESGSEVMAYDGANNLAWSAAGLTLSGTDCGQAQVATAGRTVRTYDAMNRVLTLTPPNGTQSTSYSYDALGNLKSAVSGISTWSATRNKLGQLTGETLQLTGQDAWHVGYAHDAYGSLARLTYPDGRQVAYAPDALGRASQVGSYASGITYFPNGEVQSFAYGNGTLYAAEQSVRQVLTNFSYGHGSTLLVSQDLAYDPNGNIITMTDLVDGQRTKSFGYDALNRLTSATASHLWGTETYTYDPLNNIRTRVGNGQTFTYHYDPANHLASISGAGSSSFVYDNRGNVTGKNGLTLDFDQKNQLLQIPGLDNYAYDAAGRRVMKASGGAATYYFYTQAGQLLYQWEPATALGTDFIYLGRRLIARTAANQTAIAGIIDGVFLDSANNAWVRGWACSTGIAQSISVDLYLGGPAGSGQNIGRYQADAASEPAVASTCKVGSGNYRFSIPLSVSLRSTYAGQMIYLEGISPVGNSNVQLEPSGTYAVPVPPVDAAPAVLAPASNTSGSYSVSWSALDDATSYLLQEQVDGGVWTPVYTGAGTSQAISGKGDGSYGYRAQACNAGGCGSWSAPATTAVLLPPATPTDAVAQVTDVGVVTVSWTGSATADTYDVESQYNGGDWLPAQSGVTGTSTALTVSQTGTYAFRVAARNASGTNGETAPSNTVTVTLPPSVAPNLSIPATSYTGSYTVSWSAVDTATSYTLQQQVNGGAWSTIYTGSGRSEALSGKGRATFGYRAQACNSVGCGPWSGTASIAVTAPAPPPTITVPSKSTGNVAVSWGGSAGATKYTLQHARNGGGWSTAYSGSATSHTVTESTSGTWAYRVAACDAVGCSGYRNSPSVSVLRVPPPPTGLSAVVYVDSERIGGRPSTTFTLDASWHAAVDATSYGLQICGSSGGTCSTLSTTKTTYLGNTHGTGQVLKVRACDASGCSPWSAAVTASTSYQ